MTIEELSAEILAIWARNVDEPHGNVETLARLAARTAIGRLEIELQRLDIDLPV